MDHTAPIGLLSLAVINILIFAIFAFSFAPVRNLRSWQSLGVLSAFVVLLFVEMYGFPLTIYVVSAWATSRYPDIDPFAFSAGRRWNTLFGFKRDSHVHPIYFLSYLLVGSGSILIAYAWRTLYQAQRLNQLARTGAYSWIRHPQYLGFVMVMLGILLAWPAASTLIMFPILVAIYVRLARRGQFHLGGESFRC